MKKFLILGVIVSIVSLGYLNRAITIEIIIPDDFSGVVHLIKDEDGNEPDIRWGIRRRYTFYIGKEGSLKVNSLKPFFKWHIFEARYASGKTLDSFDHVARDFGIGSLANIQSGEEAVQGVVYFIGPYQDYQARRALSY